MTKELPIQWLNGGEVEHLAIDYPVSRHRQFAVGRFGRVPASGIDPSDETDPEVPSFLAVVLSEPTRSGDRDLEAGSMLAIDPRCLVRSAETGAVRYDPRDHIDDMGPWFRTWMREHPTWPGRRLSVRDAYRSWAGTAQNDGG